MTASVLNDAQRKSWVKIAEFDGLRGLMAMIVVSSHLFADSSIGPEKLWKPFRFLTDGGLGVDVFIILSGFVIFFLLDRSRETYGVFLWRRFWRLFPAYLVCLLLGVALSFVAVDWLQRLPWRDSPLFRQVITNWGDASRHLWPHLGWHLLLLHGLWPSEILPNSTGAFLEPAWSISLEWQFYLVAPFIYGVLRRRWGVLLCLVGVWVSFQTIPYCGDWLSRGRIVTYNLHAFLPLNAHYFFIGVASYYLYRAVMRSSARVPVVILPVTVLGLMLFSDDLGLAIWAVVLGSHLVIQRGSEFWMSRWTSGFLNSNIVQAVGRVSYSVYLLHTAAIYLGIYCLTALHVTWTPGRFLIALTVFVLPLVAVGASLLYRFVEKPAMDWAKKCSPFVNTTKASPLAAVQKG